MLHYLMLLLLVTGMVVTGPEDTCKSTLGCVPAKSSYSADLHLSGLHTGV